MTTTQTNSSNLYNDLLDEIHRDNIVKGLDAGLNPSQAIAQADEGMLRLLTTGDVFGAQDNDFDIFAE